MTMNIYDPEIDDSGFTDNVRDKFEGVGEAWFLNYGQGLFDQNSYNFKEFLKFLADLKTKYYIPSFRMDKVKIKRTTRKIESPDGRISTEWSEEIDSSMHPWIVDAIYTLCILMFGGAIGYKLFGSALNICIQNLFRIDISLVPGTYVKVFLQGGRDVAKLMSNKSKSSRKIRKLVLALFERNSKGKKTKLRALPEWRELLPYEKARRRLPPARPG